MNGITNWRSYEDIARRAQEIATQIYTETPADKSLLFLVILKGGAPWAHEVIKAFGALCENDNTRATAEIAYAKIKSYEGKDNSKNITMALDESELANKHIIVLEDIVDSGKTFSELIPYLLAQGAASVKTCALIDKIDARGETCKNLRADYAGFTITKEDTAHAQWLVGFGMDLDEKFREYPGIYILKS